MWIILQFKNNKNGKKGIKFVIIDRLFEANLYVVILVLGLGESNEKKS